MIAVLAACSSDPEAAPEPAHEAPQGVTDTSIAFGTHMPLTGPASGGYSKIAPATKAYFDYVNKNGGVYGRQITYKIVDDGYNPATTQTVVRQLVQEDKVFGILNGLGTPTHTGVLDFLKESEVPDLFVASGAISWNQPTKYPDTFGVQPDYTTEGKIIGDYVKKNFAGKKVCHFGQDDDFGRDALAGLEKGLGAPVTAKEKYVTSNQNVAPQMSALKDAGCEVVVTAAIPGFVTLAIGKSAGIAFRPQWIASGVGGDYTTVSTPLGASAAVLMEGFLTTGYLPAATNADDPWIKLFQKINTEFNANAPFDGNIIYGMSIGYLTVQALLAAGQKLTVAGLEKAIQDNGAKWKGPGLVPFSYSPTSHAGYAGVRLSRVTAGVQAYFGPAYITDQADAPVKEYTEAPSVPPANGIPTA